MAALSVANAITVGNISDKDTGIRYIVPTDISAPRNVLEWRPCNHYNQKIKSPIARLQVSQWKSFSSYQMESTVESALAGPRIRRPTISAGFNTKILRWKVLPKKSNTHIEPCHA